MCMKLMLYSLRGTPSVKKVLNEWVLRQNGCCKICKKRVTYRLLVDHCHTTGYIRGLVCRQCNNLLGQAKDDPEILRSAAYFLEHFESQLVEKKKIF